MIEDFYTIKINVQPDSIFSLIVTINYVLFYWFIIKRVFPFKEPYIVQECFNK